MKYLIVMPLMRSSQKQSYILPLGILYISSVMKSEGFCVHTLNLNHCQEPWEDLKARISLENIDVVLSGGMSPQYNEIRMIFDHAKQVNPDIITICGGGLISGDPEAAMAALEVDYGILDEGEKTVVELCRSIENEHSVSEVKGVIIKDEGSYITTEEREALQDIDKIPWPDYEGFNFSQFLDTSNVGCNGINYGRAGMIITSRSCPFSCTFCFHTTGRKYRQRSMDRIFEEIDYLVSKYNIGFLYVSDELFSLNEERVRLFCARIKAYNLPWNVSFRVDGITDDILDELKKANCVSIGLGIESADNSILKSMRKAVTIEKIESALEKIYRSGIPVVGNFIFGDINETSETAARTIEWWKRNKKYGLFMKMIKVYPGTYIYQDAIKRGLIKDTVQFLKDGCPPLNISRMSEQEMADLVKDITLLPFKENAKINDVRLIEINKKNSSCSLAGKCHYCGKDSEWDSVALFSLNYVSCPHCNGKMSIPIPETLVDIIDENLKKLLKKNLKLALWGMADYAMEFLCSSVVVAQNPDIDLIDLSGEKQLMDIVGKQVFPPDIIKINNIDAVIVLVPVFFSTIKSQVQSRYGYPHIFSITDLYNPSFGPVPVEPKTK